MVRGSLGESSPAPYVIGPANPKSRFLYSFTCPVRFVYHHDLFQALFARDLVFTERYRVERVFEKLDVYASSTKKFYENMTWGENFKKLLRATLLCTTDARQLPKLRNIDPEFISALERRRPVCIQGLPLEEGRVDGLGQIYAAIFPP